MPRLLPSLGLPLLLAFSCGLYSPRALAQTGAKTAPRSPNVKPGSLVALDDKAQTVTLKERAGKLETFGLTGKTRFLKSRRAAQVSDFHAGETVVLHVRKSREDDTHVVSEMTDPASWEWLTTMRHTITPATIQEMDEDTLTAAVGTDAIPLEYTISEKTDWSRDGKPASSKDFKAGDKIYIVPRALPSGAIMAREISNSEAGAGQLKERAASTVHGVVSAVNGAAHSFTLTTVAGDARTLLYTGATEIHSGAKTLPLSALRAGLHVAARVHHQEVGEDVAWRVNLEAAHKKGKAARPSASATPAPKPKPQ